MGCCMSVISDPAMRGITLAQLEALMDNAQRERGDSYFDESLNLYDFVDQHLKPWTKSRKCSGVELVAHRSQIPTYFVSHWWGEPLINTFRMLKHHAVKRGLEEDTTYWICAFALNQHDIEGEMGDDLMTSPFARALDFCKGTISILDGEGVALERAWCAYEMFLTLNSSETKTHDFMTRDPSPFILETEILDGFGVDPFFHKVDRESLFPAALLAKGTKFQLENVKATMETDLQAIFDAIGPDKDVVNQTIASRFAVVQLPNILRLSPSKVGEHTINIEEILEKIQGSRMRHLILSWDRHFSRIGGFLGEGNPRDPKRLDKLVEALPATVSRVFLNGMEIDIMFNFVSKVLQKQGETIEALHLSGIWELSNSAEFYVQSEEEVATVRKAVDAAYEAVLNPFLEVMESGVPNLRAVLLPFLRDEKFAIRSWNALSMKPLVYVELSGGQESGFPDIHPSDAMIAALVGILESSPVEYFKLSGCNLSTSEAMEKLVKGLKSANRLRVLRLCSCFVRGEAAKTFAKVLPKLKLLCLDLASNPIDLGRATGQPPYEHLPSRALRKGISASSIGLSSLLGCEVDDTDEFGYGYFQSGIFWPGGTLPESGFPPMTTTLFETKFRKYFPQYVSANAAIDANKTAQH